MWFAPVIIPVMRTHTHTLKLNMWPWSSRPQNQVIRTSKIKKSSWPQNQEIIKTSKSRNHQDLKIKSLGPQNQEIIKTSKSRNHQDLKIKKSSRPQKSSHHQDFKIKKSRKSWYQKSSTKISKSRHQNHQDLTLIIPVAFKWHQYIRIEKN